MMDAWAWWSVWGVFVFFLVLGAASWMYARWDTRRGNPRWDFTPYGWIPLSSEGRHSGVGPRGYRRTDDRIKEDISDRLTIHGEINAAEIEVDVRDTVVTLRGTVESRSERRIAEAIADSVPGVSDVINQLALRRPASPTKGEPYAA